MELTDLYSEKILAIAGRLTDMEPLAHADARARKVSRVCGSTISVELAVTDGVVTGYSHQVNACALGQTSAAIMAEHVVGASTGELRRVRDEMIAMLKQDGQPPAGERWDDLQYLEPVRSYTPRHTSTLLVFEAVVDCLDQIEREGETNAAQMAVSSQSD